MRAIGARIGRLRNRFHRSDRAQGEAARAAVPVALFAPRCAIALLLGALVVMRLPSLPASWVGLSLCAIGAGWWVFAKRMRWAGALLFGFGWACVIAAHALALRIPPALVGDTVVVSGRIVGLPQRDDRLQRFDLRADLSANPQGIGGRLLHLSWDSRDLTPAPGERWRLPLRLKRPRGTLNPGGFDFERWALQRRIAANGYVRDDGSAQRLASASGIDALRARLSQRIADAVPGPGSRFVRALALGDTRWLDQHDWEVLRATGLTHLIAISGFHVGIVAAFGALLAWLLYALVPRLGLRVPRPQAQAVAALLFAFGYTALAGFELPTVRTLLMIAAALAARLWRRPASVAQSLALALITILLIDPLAVLAAGFWLSFAGVAWLVWCLPEGDRGGRLRAFLGAQGVATLGLLPLTVWFFGQASLVAPLSNLFGIPWISLVAVPLSLIALAVDLIAPGIGAPLLRLAAWSMDAIWPLLAHVAAWPGALAWLPAPSLPALLLALAGAFWLLLPRGVAGKPLAVFLLLPLLWPHGDRIGPGEARLAMIDVGQGLSMLVRTQHHALLYDAGPSYSGGLDMGEAAVVPGLHALGVPRLDALVVSHGDNDHAGGADAVLQVYPAPVRFGAPGWPRGAGYAPCLRDIAWRWDGVEFRFLHPPLYFPYLKNDSGCVLRIAGPGWSVLLPADIESVVEQRLLREQPDLLHADVIAVPHHGSLTSSSEDFVRTVAPTYALISVGYRNRFRHPRAAIVRRWLDAGSDVEDTASAGMLQLRLDAGGAHLVGRSRVDQRRFWQEQVPSAAESALQAPSAPSAGWSLHERSVPAASGSLHERSAPSARLAAEAGDDPGRK
jgi:competence protein ComEC